MRDRLHGRGETAPKAWTRAQILLRLVELEGDHILKTEKEEPTPLRQWEVRINQASKKKAELQTLLAKDLHVGLNPDWTIDMLRLKALGAVASVTPGHKNDPVGFGKWCHLKYHEVLTTDPQYCQWVTTAGEGDASPRLCCLAQWLQSQPLGEPVMMPKTKSKPPVTNPGQGDADDAGHPRVEPDSAEPLQGDGSGQDGPRGGQASNQDVRGRDFWDSQQRMGANEHEPRSAVTFGADELIDAPETRAGQLSLPQARGE